MWSVVIRMLAVFAACGALFAAGLWCGACGRGLELAAALAAGAILVAAGRWSAAQGSQSRSDQESGEATDDRASV